MGIRGIKGWSASGEGRKKGEREFVGKGIGGETVEERRGDGRLG
jgi:hypothetical protein